MDPITYSLRAGQPRSDAYYQTVEHFTDEVLSHADTVLGPMLGRFEAYQAGRDDRRTRPEILFEVLTLGVLWRVYAPRAQNLSRAPQRVMRVLGRWRERGEWVKIVVDRVRGPLAALFLARDNDAAAPALSLNGLEHLLGWLEAAGDFEQEVKRLRLWQDFFAVQPGEMPHHGQAITALTAWFDARSLEVLGGYTAQVETFLQEQHPFYRWREDAIFCGRQQIEYHLNMVGVVIMNRAFRDTFLAAPKKIVLVPPCMRARSEDECQARATPFGAQCAACEPRCHVHHVTKLGEKYGFAVFMLPDELATFSPGAGARAAMAEIGIVGVSCPLTIVQGGWKTRALHIPAQGLPLDYCGCSWHWHLDGGIPTDLNLRELLRVVGRPPLEDTPQGRI